MDVIDKPVILAVSGAKNTGKTTLIEAILPFLKSYGLKIAVIKHDGHDFEADVAGTDTYRHKKAGAYATAIFSKHKYMIVKDEEINEQVLIRQFSEADLILLEGFKYSDYPKIELVRKEVSEAYVCDPKMVLTYISDGELKNKDKDVLPFHDKERIAKFIYNYYQEERNRRCNNGDS